MSAIMKIALPVLAAVGSAYADCSASSTLTIQNSGDAPTSCSTYSGSIAVQTDAAGPIAIDGIKKIAGDLTLNNNANIQSFTGADLEEVTGEFSLSGVQKLSTVSFAKLTTVKTLTIVGLPNLQQLDTKITKAANVDIENTQLQNLNGVNITTVDNMKVANNFYISTLSIPLGNVTEALTFSNNNPEMNVTLDSLTAAKNLTFVNCSSLSVPNLENTTGSLGLYGNGFESFAAPKLGKVGGALAVYSNTELTNLSFPSLTAISADLQVSNNTKLAALNQTFPQLQSINGAVTLNGNFSSIALPKLNSVQGTFTVKSSGDIQSQCDNDLKPLSDSKKIRGTFKCSGKDADPNNPNASPTSTAGGAKKSSPAMAVNVENSALMMGLAAAFFL